MQRNSAPVSTYDTERNICFAGRVPHDLFHFVPCVPFGSGSSATDCPAVRERTETADVCRTDDSEIPFGRQGISPPRKGAFSTFIALRRTGRRCSDRARPARPLFGRPMNRNLGDVGRSRCSAGCRRGRRCRPFVLRYEDGGLRFGPTYGRGRAGRRHRPSEFPPAGRANMYVKRPRHLFMRGSCDLRPSFTIFVRC